MCRFCERLWPNTVDYILKKKKEVRMHARHQMTVRRWWRPGKQPRHSSALGRVSWRHQNLICTIVIVTGRCNFKPLPEEQSLHSDSVFEDEKEHSEALLLHLWSAAAVNVQQWLLRVTVSSNVAAWPCGRKKNPTTVWLCFSCAWVGVGKGDCGRLQGKQDERRESRLWRWALA